jgi:flagellin
MLSIQTNVNSLVAQQNLGTNSIFQSKTIQQLTSGYRINSSGDDAAGLAVANKFRNQTAELNAGVSNGNNAVAQLQIMDGGITNIGQMLDRLKTLAMQSSSATATSSDRAVLNNEFQTDVAEIDRQAQSIGLNMGGSFAKNLGIYLGAGSGSQSQANSVVNIDLSKATVDSQSLGLSGVTAVNLHQTAGAYDVANDTDLGSGANSVASVIAAGGGGLSFTFTGVGFGGSTNAAVSLTASQTGVSDTASLVASINQQIQATGAGGTAADLAFAAAGITASVHTDSSGKQQLAFSSANSAFQVQGTSVMANAMLGFTTAANNGLGSAANANLNLISGGAYELATAATSSTTVSQETDIAFTAALSAGTQAVTISANDSNGVAHQKTVTFTQASGGVIAGDTVAHDVAYLNDQLQASNDSTLKNIVAVTGAGSSINFVSTNSQFSVAVGQGGPTGTTGLTATSSKSALQVGIGGVADISTMQGAQAAVTAITAAVTALGSAQAAIGKGENELGYAVSLAQSQITNYSAAESNIRDANVAQQAANLTKAQVLQQASIAAMAQANSAPQAVLTLLRG